MGRSGIKGDPVDFLPMKRMPTVEKIATIGVMAGCSPEHMPILLAMAEAGGGCGDGRGGGWLRRQRPDRQRDWHELRRQHARSGQSGQPQPRPCCRTDVAQLRRQDPVRQQLRRLGQQCPNMIPENDDGLPPGWKTLREEYDFKKNESCLVNLHMGGGSHQLLPRRLSGFPEVRPRRHCPSSRCQRQARCQELDGIHAARFLGNGEGGMTSSCCPRWPSTSRKPVSRPRTPYTNGFTKRAS